MKKQSWITFLLAGTLLFGVSGCTNSTSADVTLYPESSSQGQNSYTFAFNINMKTSPATPVAGQPFKLQFFRQKPANHGSSPETPKTPENPKRRKPSGLSPEGPNANTPASNGMAGQTNTGATAPFPGATMSAVVTGNSVHQTVSLSRQNGVLAANLTLAQPGTYQVTFSMNMEHGTIEHRFSLNVAS